LCDTVASAIISGSFERSGSYGPGAAGDTSSAARLPKTFPAISETGVLAMCRMSRM